MHRLGLVLELANPPILNCIMLFLGLRELGVRPNDPLSAHHVVTSWGDTPRISSSLRSLTSLSPTDETLILLAPQPGDIRGVLVSSNADVVWTILVLSMSQPSGSASRLLTV